MIECPTKQMICYDWGEFDHLILRPLVEVQPSLLEGYREIVDAMWWGERAAIGPARGHKCFHWDMIFYHQDGDFGYFPVAKLIQAVHDKYDLPYDFYLVE